MSLGLYSRFMGGSHCCRLSAVGQVLGWNRRAEREKEKGGGQREVVLLRTGRMPATFGRARVCKPPVGLSAMTVCRFKSLISKMYESSGGPP